MILRSQRLKDESEKEEMRLRGAKDYDYFIILPDDPFKALWDFTNILVLLSVCIITPARIAFTDADDLTWMVVGFFFDLLFAIDLILNFFMAYHDEEFNLIDDRKVRKLLL